MSQNKLAAVLIRGLMGTTTPVRDTLSHMNLRKKHTCVVVEDNAHNRGMMQKTKDFITFGSITQETIEELKKARKPLVEGKDKLVFALAPPKGGFERKGIKKSHVQGGALGLRKEGIDALIKKMM